MSTNNARASGKTVKRKKVGVDLSLGLQFEPKLSVSVQPNPLKAKISSLTKQ